MEGKSVRELTGQWRDRVQENEREFGGKSTRELTGDWRERVQENYILLRWQSADGKFYERSKLNIRNI